MPGTKLLELADKIEAALEVDPALAQEVFDAINALEATGETEVAVSNLDSTDELLSLVTVVLPGWTIGLKGKAWQPNGHWTCSLRIRPRPISSLQNCAAALSVILRRSLP